MREVHGLHHVTAIAGTAQDNLDFYSGTLGMRLVKKSVNQDDPGTYHLFYADGAGAPGTDLTFFPWSQMAPSRRGHGLASEVTLAVPPDSLDWWQERLRTAGVPTRPLEERFGERALPFSDPHGLDVALVESDGAAERDFTPWGDSPVPADRQIRGLDGARLELRDVQPSGVFLAAALGYREAGRDGDWQRWLVGDGRSGRRLDLRARPEAPRGMWGTGSIHHLAFRVDDEPHQLEVRAAAAAAGTRPTEVIDRFWFRSVYFKEPGGVLYELATDGPGFAVDEDPEHLGETLVLPPWLEDHRGQIERALPPLAPPGGAPRS
jgi:glyoxalase family protein